MGIHRDWIVLDAQYQIEEMRDNLRTLQLNQTLGNDDDSEDEKAGTDVDDDGDENLGDTDNNDEEAQSDGDGSEEEEEGGSGDNDAEAADVDSKGNITDDTNEEDEVESPYTCSRCQNPTLLNDDTTFYKCFRHSCRGTFWVLQRRMISN